MDNGKATFAALHRHVTAWNESSQQREGRNISRSLKRLSAGKFWVGVESNVQNARTLRIERRKEALMLPHHSGSGLGASQIWPIQDGFEILDQVERMASNWSPGKGPSAAYLAFSRRCSGFVVPGIAVWAPGTLSVKRNPISEARSL